MAPPTASEQLIRDYLNRLSLAARDLAPDDRRALLERTRGLIEQKADLARRPSTMDVGRVLARLGDPARLVEQERRRLAAQGKSARPAMPTRPAATETPARQRFLARALRREPGRLRGPSFGWQVQPASRGSARFPRPSAPAGGIHQPDRQAPSDTRAATAVDEATPAAPETQAQPSPPVPPNGTLPGAAARPGAKAPEVQEPAVVPGRSDTSGGQQPADASSPVSGTASDSPDAVASADAAAASRTWPAGERATEAGSTATLSGPDPAEDRDERRWRRQPTAAGYGPANRQLSRMLGWARKRPLEAAVIVLMGVGGPIFPPVFLIGATLALASELWDGRDKWVGLALPVVMTVIGLAVGVAAGGRAHWMHEGWVYLNVTSRVAPALGAGYLAWRCQQPRRPSAVPPFSRPRRAS